MMVGQQPAMANLLHCGMPGGPSHPSHPLKHTALHFPHLRATQVVAYYIEQSKANNHAVREAACACIAELMCKASRICPRLAGGAVEMIGLLGIRAALRVYLQLHPLLPLLQVDKQAVAPFVPRLLRALVTCFKDASWPVSSTRQAARAPAIVRRQRPAPPASIPSQIPLPTFAQPSPLPLAQVRDAACLACGRCVTAFPEESREVLEELYTLWFAHLEDNIYSVREDSAAALGNAGWRQAGMGGRMWIVDLFQLLLLSRRGLAAYSLRPVF
jgi:ferredoxin